ncbi:MAG TPA: SCP2 sterol-binding domain-containing protein [Acidimicrobiales bacterium]
MSHAFLSDPWFDAVEELRSEQPDAPDAMADATINITVTGGPDGDVDVHLAGGAFDRGHTEGAPTRLTVPYEVAKKLFIDGDQSAAMQAFMSGQIKVEGDMTKVMALQTVTPTAEQQAFQAKLADLTN